MADGIRFVRIVNKVVLETVLIHMLFIRNWFFILFLLPLSVRAETISGKVIGIKDGDTIVLLTSQNQQYIIRLAHIDAPEKGQPFGAQAKWFTSSLLFEQDVRAEVTTTDQYGRLICVVFKDGENINQEILRKGYAWWFRKYSSDADYEEIENQAAARKIGLWCDENPIPPWDWRRNRKRQEALSLTISSNRIRFIS